MIGECLKLDEPVLRLCSLFAHWAELRAELKREEPRACSMRVPPRFHSWWGRRPPRAAIDKAFWGCECEGVEGTDI